MIFIQGPMIFSAVTKGILHTVSSAILLGAGKSAGQRSTTPTPVSCILYMYLVPVSYETRWTITGHEDVA